jgi:hypothetical protein
MKAKHCDECKHFSLKANEPCQLGYKPRYFYPNTMEKAKSGNWGYKRRCDDFQERKK